MHRVIPDEAGVTNQFSASFGTYITEGNFISVSGLADASVVIDGPDRRGYATGQKERQTLTVVCATNDPTAYAMENWYRASENGLGRSIGTVTVKTASGVPVAVYELNDCIVAKSSYTDLNIESPEVSQATWEISYSSLTRVQ